MKAINFHNIFKKKFQCTKPTNIFARPSKFCMRMDLTEDEMKAIVYKYGPATIGYNTEDPNFFKVKSGPYNRKCRNNVADHAMLVIGWDKDNWIIKNSYSVGWGAEGYLYAPRAYAPGCA